MNSRYSFTMLVLILATFLTGYSQSINIGPSPAYFGGIPVGSDQSETMTLLNISPNALSVSGMTIKGASAENFTIVENPAPTTLSGYATLIFEVLYTPTSVGQDRAVLEITTDNGIRSDTLKAYGTRIKSGLPTFERLLGYEERIEAYALSQTGDGGFVIAGSTQQSFFVNDDIYVVKTDRYGKEEWHRIYESETGGQESYDEKDDESRDVLPLSDGSIILLGISDSEIYLTKWDSQGEFIWEAFYGEDYGDEPVKFIQDSRGDLVIVGSTTNTPDQTSNVMIVKINPENGTLVWKKDYGTPDIESGVDIAEMPDGGYVVAGNYQKTTEPNLYFLKVDADGNQEWSRIHSSTMRRGIYAVQNVNSGGIVASGYKLTEDKGMQGYLVRLDATGEIQWEKTFGAAHVDDFSSVVETSDGGFLCVGSKNQYFSSEEVFNDLWLVKTDAAGNLVWEEVFGGVLDEKGVDIIKTAQEGYAFLGETTSFTSKSKIYFLQSNAAGEILTDVKRVTQQGPDECILLQNYPNPFNPVTRIDFSLPQQEYVELKIYDVTGREVADLVHEVKAAGRYKVDFDASSLSSGIYVCQLRTANTVAVRKLALIK